MSEKDPNTIKYNAAKKEKNITPVVDDKSHVKLRKKSLGKKFTETFLSDDLESVKKYAVHDVIIPAIKDTIVNIVKDGIEMLFYGSTKGSSSTKYGNVTYVSYNSLSDKKANNKPYKQDDIPNYNEIILDSRGIAEKVLEQLRDMIAQYGSASVADLMELVNLDSSFTDWKYGWTNLRGSTVKRVRGGYLIVLPRPEILTD